MNGRQDKNALLRSGSLLADCLVANEREIHSCKFYFFFLRKNHHLLVIKPAALGVFVDDDDLFSRIAIAKQKHGFEG